MYFHALNSVLFLILFMSRNRTSGYVHGVSGFCVTKQPSEEVARARYAQALKNGEVRRVT